MDTNPTSPADSLIQPLEAWRGGSRRAGDLLFRRLRRRLEGYVGALATELGSLDGEDLLQDVFLTFLTQVDGFDVSGGDGALICWFQTTLKRRWWAMSARSRRTVAVGGAAEVFDAAPCAVAPVAEARLELDGRLKVARGAARGEGGTRFQRRSQQRILRALDQVEAVVLGGAQPSTSSGELARVVGWSAFQMWQMTARMQQAVGASPVVAAPSGEQVTLVSGASVPIVESASTQPEAVTPGNIGESRKIAFGTDAQLIRRYPARSGPRRLSVVGRRGHGAAGPGPRVGRRATAESRFATRLTRDRPGSVRSSPAVQGVQRQRSLPPPLAMVA